MATRVHTLSHPWLDSPSKKRKSPTSDHDAPGTSSPYQNRKRRRCSTLEQGFAHLTLNTLKPSITTSPTFVVEPVPNVTNHNSPVITPSSVEEPDTPDVKMQTWYEPEKDRIVVTDLDDCDDDPVPQSEVIIPAAVLDHLKSASTHQVLPTGNASPDAGQCMALVLFRPGPSLGFWHRIGDKEDGERKRDKVETSLVEPSQGDDAMEIDP